MSILFTAWHVYTFYGMHAGSNPKPKTLHVSIVL